MVDSGVAGRVAESLEARGIAVATFSDIQGEPTTDYVDAGVAALRAHEADGVVAVGGGSPLDTGKAIAVMATNEGPLPDYLGYHKIPEPGAAAHRACPTTAGTGSEVTRVTVITDTSRDVKMMILSNHLMPQVALADFKLTLTCPRGADRERGRRLAHARDRVLRVGEGEPGDRRLRAEGGRLIGPNLRRAQADGGDEEAREALMLGAMLAGAAFSNASVALVHGMSRPIGAHFHVPHGLCNAVLLPDDHALVDRRRDGALRDDRAGDGLADGLDDAATGRSSTSSTRSTPTSASRGSASSTGVERDHFDRVKGDMAEAALASGSPGFNPRVPDGGGDRRAVRRGLVAPLHPSTIGAWRTRSTGRAMTSSSIRRGRSCRPTPTASRRSRRCTG